MRLQAGSRLGPYEVAAPLGAGGMGVVYRARDTRLNREVAIKVLPDLFASNAERLARFQREAQVLAALNHPHIGGIHGLEEGDGVRALVLELVEGPTLANRIAQGALPLHEALTIAIQIADALEAAHAQGIVHRDLKPANIKVRPDGVVKVLDFGLAKAFNVSASGDPSESPTVTAPTALGTILGTAAYMSPEQARGKVVDKRADIWAFGCVIYEMLTGQAAFARETVTDTIAAVLERDPDWSRLPRSIPAAVRRALRRCLEKDPRRRLRDVADARLEIEDALASPAMEAAPIPPPRVARLTLAIGLALGLAAGAAVSAWFLRTIPADVVPEFGRVVRLTSGPDRETAPAISPDAKWVAYISNRGGSPNVWVKFIAGGEPVNLTASSGLQISFASGISGLEISPDGARIAVMARPFGSALPFATWEIPAPLPGVPRKLLGENYLGVRWSPDSRQMTFIRAGSSAGDALFVADADGGNPREIIPARDGMHVHWPTWSRDGFIYFLRTFNTIANLGAADIYRIDPGRAGAPMEPVVQTTRRALFPLPVSSPRGLIYSANPHTAELRLWWDPSPGGAPKQLTSGVGEYAEARASTDGRTLVCTLYELRQSLMRIILKPGAAEMTDITDGFQGDLDSAIVPASDRIVFSSSRDGNRHLWVAREDGTDPRPLTSGPSQDELPALSPDGQQVAFVSDRAGAAGIWMVSTDGGPPRKVIDVVSTGGLTWSRDGSRIVYSAGIGAGPGLWSVPASGGAPERIQTPFFAAEPAWSPVEDVIAYLSISTLGGTPVNSVAFVHPSGGVSQTRLPAPPGGNGFSNGMLAWAPDGRRLATVQQQSNAAASVWIVDLQSATPYTKVLELPPGPRVRGITWTRDSGAIIIGKHDWTSDIVLMEQVATSPAK